MRTDQGPLSLPGRRFVQGGATRVRRTFSAAPLLLKVLMLAALVFLLPFGLAFLLPVLLLAALVYAPFAVSAAHRTVLASLSVAVCGLALVSGLSGGYRPWLALLLLLPFAVVLAAHASRTRASACRGPTTCTPMGSPAAESPQGTVAAGWWLMLNG